ncbi:MAG: protease family protein [Verrucomicrobiota bacterium]
MLIPQRQSVIRSLRTLDALLVLSVTLLVTAAPLVPPKAGIGAASGIAVLAVLAWYKRCRAAAPLSIFCVICLGLVFCGVRYFPVILGVGLLCYAGVVCGVPWLRGTATWVRWGSFDRDVRLLSAAASVLAAVALLSWYLLLHPNVANIVKAFVPAMPMGLLIFGGLIFSMVNAAVEEGAYRGVILHALDTSLGPGFAALLLQALAFGAVHIGGFPRGWLGVGLACIYGLFMGVIRRRAGGMFAPWIAHVFTDVVIAGIVIGLARPNQAMQPTTGRVTPEFSMNPTSHPAPTHADASGG